jgi:hypothetical protein
MRSLTVRPFHLPPCRALALDPVIRSSLLFLRTHLATPPAAQGEEGGGGGAGSGPEEGELELPIEPERLDK